MDPQYDNDQVVIKNPNIINYLGLNNQVFENTQEDAYQQNSNEEHLVKVA